MRIGEVLKVQQPEEYQNVQNLNKGYKPKKNHRRHRRRDKRNDELSYTDIENLMRHDSFRRGPGGAIRQKTWGK